MTNDLGLTKIGISNDPKRRQAELKNASGVDVVIKWISKRLDRNNAKAAEKKAHELLKDTRMKGEWFASLTPSAALSVLCGKLGLKSYPLDNIFGEFSKDDAISPDMFNNGHCGAITVITNTSIRFYKDSKSMSECDWFGSVVGNMDIKTIKGIDVLNLHGSDRPDALDVLIRLEDFAISGIGSYRLKEYQIAACDLLNCAFCEIGDGTLDFFDYLGNKVSAGVFDVALSYGHSIFASLNGSREINPFPNPLERAYLVGNETGGAIGGEHTVVYKNVIRRVVGRVSSMQGKINAMDLCVACCSVYEDEYAFFDDTGYIRFKFNGKEYSHEELPLSEAVQINIDLIEFI